MTNAVKPVLVATDLSDRDDEAIIQAHRWAEREKRPLVVCHALAAATVFERLLGNLDSRTQEAANIAREQALGKLMARVDELTGRAPARTTLVVEPGSAHTLVLEEAERRDAALVVVGASAKRGVERALMGSAAAQIVRHAPCAVLIARPSPGEPQVIAASDLSDPAMAAVGAATAEAARCGAKLAALHCLDLAHPILSSFEPAIVIDDQTTQAVRRACHAALRTALDRFSEGEAGAGRTIVVDGPPHRAVPNVAGELGASLVVVASHGRTGLRRVALGSVAESIAHHAPCSVLVVRSFNEA